MRFENTVDRRHVRPGSLASATLLLSLLMMAAGAAAQTAPEGAAAGADRLDPRWLPWLGCWQIEDDPAAEPNAPGAATGAVLTCLRPDDVGGIEMISVSGIGRAFTRTIRADGYRHPLEEPACRGWRRYTWATTGSRLYSRAELVCEGSGPRTVSGMSIMAPGGAWLEIQFVDAGEPSALTVRRYRRASDLAAAAVGVPGLPGMLAARSLGATRTVGPTRWTVPDVIEASAAVEGPVIEAALYETSDRFDLDADALVMLDDAGVSAEVIDLMVALSYPGDFVIDRPFGGGEVYESDPEYAGYRSTRFDDVEVYSHYASPFGHYYAWSPYDALYPWGAMPYGYSTFYVSYGYGTRWGGGGFGVFRGGGLGRTTGRGRAGGRASSSVVSPRGYTRRPVRAAGDRPQSGGAIGAGGTGRGDGAGGSSSGIRRAKPRNAPSSAAPAASSPGSRGAGPRAGSGSSNRSGGVSRRGYRRRPPPPLAARLAACGARSRPIRA